MTERVSDYRQYDLCRWLDWLEHRHSETIQLGLSRLNQVAIALNLGKSAKQVITVAGTNGKGSVVGLLESIYCQAGYRVGTYTSPHLEQFNERIRVNKTPIDDQTLCQLFCDIEFARQETLLTYFEMTTLACLLYFSQEPLDVAILEVGMGGRLDAVNLVDTDCAVITTIDYDHQTFLGNTIEAIAAEKAGIMRPCVPTIYGDVDVPQAISSQAAAMNSPLFRQGVEFGYDADEGDCPCWVGAQQVNIHSPVHPQACSMAMMVTQQLQPTLPVTQQEVIDAVNRCHIPGRLQWVLSRPAWLLDVAHNLQAVTRLRNAILSQEYSGTIRLVFAVFKDKPYAQMIELMATLSPCWYVAPLSHTRTSSALELMSVIRHHKGQGFVFDSVEHACDKASQEASDADVVVVFGSFVTVQLAKAYLNNKGIF